MPLSQTATQGLELLTRGVECIKFSSKGTASLVFLRLSTDETTLSWRKHGLSKLKRKAEKRIVQVAGVERVDVGRESAAFKGQDAFPDL